MAIRLPGWFSPQMLGPVTSRVTRGALGRYQSGRWGKRERILQVQACILTRNRERGGNYLLTLVFGGGREYLHWGGKRERDSSRNMI
jgi:hypothetical protein